MIPQRCSEKFTVRINHTCQDKGLELFEPIMPVLTHPRCINCHGIVNPLTGANHGGGKIEVPPGTDITTLRGNETCVEACHDAKVFNVTPWRLAPKNTHFVGKDSAALCQQMKQMIDANDMDFFRTHIAEDPIIELGFIGKRGGATKEANPPPMSRDELIELARKWAHDGNHSCGCFDSPPASH